MPVSRDSDSRHSRPAWTALGLGVALLAFASQIAWHRANLGVRFLSDDISLYVLEAWCEEALLGGHLPFWLHTPLVGAPYPPLVPTVAALWAFAGDRGQHAMLMSQWPFWAGSIGAAWWMSHRHHGAIPGALSALVAASLLYFPRLAGGFYTEPAVACFTLCTLAAVDASEGLRRPLPSLWVGLFAALGMLSKWSFAFFAAPAIFAGLAVGLYGAAGSDRHPLVRGAWSTLVLLGLAGVGAGVGALLRGGGLAPPLLVGGGLLAAGLGFWRAPWTRAVGVGVGLATVVGLGLAGPWYAGALPELRAFLGENLAGGYAGNRLGGWEGLLYAPAALVEALVPFPFLVLAGVGAARSLLPGASGPGRLCLVALAGACLALGLSPYGNSRYIAPAAVLFAPLAAASLPRSGWAALAGLPAVVYAAWHLTAWMDLPWNPELRARVQVLAQQASPYLRATNAGSQVMFPAPRGPQHPLLLQPMLPAGLEGPLRAPDPIGRLTRALDSWDSPGPTWVLAGAPTWLDEPRVLGGFLLEARVSRPRNPVIKLPPAAIGEYLPRVPGVAIVVSSPGALAGEALAGCTPVAVPEGLPTPLLAHRCATSLPVTLPAEVRIVPFYVRLTGPQTGPPRSQP